MVGLVDMGGGMRGAYTAGVYDYLLDENIRVPYCIGVSAGAGNMATYTAGQRGRNYRFYTDYCLRKEYISVGNFLKKGSYIDFDYAYTTVGGEGGEDPLDYDAFLENPARYTAVATSALDGKAYYFTKKDMPRGKYDVIMASSSMPAVNRARMMGGIPYYDGGIADPVPYQKALADGCDKVVVLLTRPAEFRREKQSYMAALKAMLRKYPKLIDALQQRHLKYNRALDELEELQKEGKALLIAPESIFGMSTLKMDMDAVERLYRTGYEDGEKVKAFIGAEVTQETK